MISLSSSKHWILLVVIGKYVIVANIGMRVHADETTPPSFEAAIAPLDGVIQLFDGKKTLGDCYKWLQDTKCENPRHVFQVTDGLLHITGEGYGGPVTNKAYRDCYLIREFKGGKRTWQDPKQAARDSGLLIHSNYVDGGYGGIWMPGDDKTIWKADAPCEKNAVKSALRVNWFGRDVDWTDTIGVRGAQDRESPLGEWTRIDEIADGSHVQTFVNGKLANDAFDVLPALAWPGLYSTLTCRFVKDNLRAEILVPNYLID